MTTKNIKTISFDGGNTTYVIQDETARTSIGTLSSLTTTEKGNLVGAVNEINSALGNKLEADDITATAPILYNDSTKTISANIDTVVGTNSNYLITSGAVETAITNALVSGVVYKGTWTATSQTDYSSISTPVKKGWLYYVEGSTTISDVEWKTGDFLLINADVASGGTITNVKKIDNTESTDIVRLNATQTITNKTIDADDNTIQDLQLSSLKSGVLQTSIRAVSSASDTSIASEKAIASALADKQDTISNLSTIESGAAAGATAVQPGDLATVATSGSYTDLSNKPTIPTVNNATLTIQKNSTTVKTFTANASTDVTCNITVPTKISDLTDDTSTYPVDKADTLTNLTATVTELNYVDGVTSAIQTQLNGKQDSLVSGTNIKTINNTTLLGSGNISVLTNTATGTNSTTVTGTAASGNYATNIGVSSSAGNYSTAAGYNAAISSTYGTAVGYSSGVSATYGTALGYSAKTSASYAIQLGYGTNSSASTFSVGFYNSSSSLRKNWQLLDGTTGYIPNERINMDTVPTNNSTNAITSGGVYSSIKDSTITVTQGGVTKGSFTLNQSSNYELALDSGGGEVVFRDWSVAS